MTSLSELVQAIPDFVTWGHSRKIQFFSWFLHVHQNVERFGQGAIRTSYESLHLEQPSGFGGYLTALLERRPKGMLKDDRGYYLPKQVRDEFDTSYGQRAATVVVHALLADLPKKLPSINERVFLEEALICFKHKAYRAAIVMAWNLAFDHIREYVFTKHLTAFNLQGTKIHHKKRLPAGVVKLEDFDEYKESEFLEIARGANIIDGNAFKILEEKLTKRNMAAHPSTVIITQIQAEEFISDLVPNVVLRFV